MFHVKHLFGFATVFILFVNYSFSQGTIVMRDKVTEYHIPVDSAILKQLDAATGYNNLSKEAKDCFYYLNYARRNPAVFLQKAINVFLINHPEVKSSYTKSLQKLFLKPKPIAGLVFSIDIAKLSQGHAEDLELHQVISHTSTNGTTFQQRIAAVMVGCGSESIHATTRFDAVDTILSLLFDFNVPDLGHRKSLLNPSLTRAGVGVALSAKGNSILVFDFSCK